MLLRLLWLLLLQLTFSLPGLSIHAPILDSGRIPRRIPRWLPARKTQPKPAHDREPYYGREQDYHRGWDVRTGVLFGSWWIE